ncbi:MAG: flagellar motor switch protein FliN [bacterium]
MKPGEIESERTHGLDVPTFKRQGGQKNIIDIHFFRDISIHLVIELGGTTMTVKDLLELGPGSVVVLKKAAGESIDILANGKLIAKGEILLIEETFGVRVTEIVEPIV